MDKPLQLKYTLQTVMVKAGDAYPKKIQGQFDAYFKYIIITFYIKVMVINWLLRIEYI